MADNISLYKFYYWNNYIGQLFDTCKLLDIYWSNTIIGYWPNNSEEQTWLYIIYGYWVTGWHSKI